MVITWESQTGALSAPLLLPQCCLMSCCNFDAPHMLLLLSKHLFRYFFFPEAGCYFCFRLKCCKTHSAQTLGCIIKSLCNHPDKLTKTGWPPRWAEKLVTNKHLIAAYRYVFLHNNYNYQWEWSNWTFTHDAAQYRSSNVFYFLKSNNNLFLTTLSCFHCINPTRGKRVRSLVSIFFPLCKAGEAHHNLCHLIK